MADDLMIRLAQALGPARMNPNLAAQGQKYRANMTPPDSVMDPRYPAYANAQREADTLEMLANFPGPGEALAMGKALASALTAKGLAGGMAVPLFGAVKGFGKVPESGLSELSMAAKRKPEYGIEHRPPKRESGAPLHDMTGGGNVYPDDIYSKSAAQYYGHYGQNDPLDVQTVRLFQSYKGNPEAPVTIYRAVPKDTKASDINAGDWVTINPAYAKAHGESALNGEYRIISKQVSAKDIFTNGDSIHEWGYDPMPTLKSE